MYNRPDTGQQLDIGRTIIYVINYKSNGLEITGRISEDNSISVKAHYEPSQSHSYEKHFHSEGYSELERSLLAIERNICKWIGETPEWVQFTAFLMHRAKRLRSLYMTLEDWGAREWVRWIEYNDQERKDSLKVYGGLPKPDVEINGMDSLRNLYQNVIDSKEYGSESHILTYMQAKGFEPPFELEFCMGICRTILLWIKHTTPEKETV